MRIACVSLSMFFHFFVKEFKVVGFSFNTKSKKVRLCIAIGRADLAQAGFSFI